MTQRTRERARALLLRCVEEPGARALKSLRLSPNMVTLLGFLVTVLGAVLVGMGHLRVGGLVFLAGGALDLFDGALARLSGRVTPFGALLDSLFDLGAAGRRFAFLRGRLLPVSPARCGQSRVLDVVPTSIHQRVPTVIGSKEEVELCASLAAAAR